MPTNTCQMLKVPSVMQRGSDLKQQRDHKHVLPPRPVCESSGRTHLASSCRCFPPVVCLCSEVMLELALLSAVTHLQLRQGDSSRQLGVSRRTPIPLPLKCLCGESAGCLSDPSASWARWRWADCVAACCYSAHFISSFSLWFLFLNCEYGKSLASRPKRHLQKKK